MAAAARPSLRRVGRAAERELRHYRRSWVASVFSLFAAPLLFLVTLGYGLEGLVEEPESFGGLSYLEFVAPGLLVGAPVLAAGNSGLWPIMAGHRWLGFHHAMVASPIRPAEVALGWLVWVGGRALVQATVLLIVASALGAIGSIRAVAALPLAVVTAVAFTAPLMAFTARQDSDRWFDPISRVGIAPLYLFSGLFFAVESLPLLLRVVVAIFPLWHAVELSRWLAAGLAPAWSPLLHLAVVLAWLIAGGRAAQQAFAWRLRS
ncbi:MAG: ABC transporter permease [Actinomycetota bacterium]